jgi:hypothetical protein
MQNSIDSTPTGYMYMYVNTLYGIYSANSWIFEPLSTEYLNGPKLFYGKCACTPAQLHVLRK